jgi:hypothetical protein
MRDVALEIITSQRERYLVGTVTKFRRLLWGEQEDFLGYHWASRKNNELREDWVSNETIAHILTPPSPQQEASKLEAERLVELFSPADWRWPLLALLLAGLVAIFRSPQRWAGLLLVLLVLALAVPAAALVGYVPRYRYPCDPLMAVLVGGGVAWLAAQVRAGRVALRGRRAATVPGGAPGRAGLTP